MAKQVICVETGEPYGTVPQAAKRLNVSLNRMYEACRFSNRTVQGFHFQYAGVISSNVAIIPNIHNTPVNRTDLTKWASIGNMQFLNDPNDLNHSVDVTREKCKFVLRETKVNHITKVVSTVIVDSFDDITAAKRTGEKILNA